MRTFKLICDLFPEPRERVRVYPGDSVRSTLILPPFRSLQLPLSFALPLPSIYFPRHNMTQPPKLNFTPFNFVVVFFYTKPLTLLSQGSLQPYGARSRSSELVFNTFSKNHYFRRISN